MEIQQTNLDRRSNGLSRGDGGARRARANLALRRCKIEVESDQDLSKLYPDLLNFYTTPPPYSVSLQEFEQFAVERLKLLRVIEKKNVDVESSSSARYTNEYFSTLLSQIRKMQKELSTYDVLFSKEVEVEDVLQARKIDHISHFLLRLAYARTDEQRKWFLSLEVDFFRLKLWYMHDITPILKKYNLPFDEISNDVKKEFYTNINDASFSMAPSTHPTEAQVFKVKFTHALDLVKNRKVFLYEGFAYVPYNDLTGVISVKFRAYVSESLSLLKKNIHTVEDDERLRPLLNGFEKRYLGNDTSIKKSGDSVTVAQLSTFSEKSFPLCMKHLYNVCNKEHHLKHFGRLQLGLFFKGLGLPMDEATKFWRGNFTKKPEIDTSRFDKQYLYNIRHMYGQEGRRADYTPYSCMKVINSSVGPGDHHGCPFRHSDENPLRAKLVEANIPADGVREIMKLVDEKHYQIACQRYFEWTHDKHSVDGGVNHPNQYFIESRDILTGKKTLKSEGKVETIRSVYYKNGQKGSQNSDLTEAMDVSSDQNVDAFELDDEHDAVLAEYANMEY